MPRTHLAAALAAALLAATSARAICEPGETVDQPCEHIHEAGCCEDDVLWWCDAGWRCRLDCAAISELRCGWDANDPAGPHYDCGTGGLSAPGSDPPIACDLDGDGFHYGMDCDDDDPAVNPDSGEDCGNGVDDDCDGDTDGEDPDCADDDDGGDDDGGDDDGGEEDDDSVGLEPIPGFLCRCSAARPGAVGGGAIILILAAAWLVSGRRSRPQE